MTSESQQHEAIAGIGIAFARESLRQSASVPSSLDFAYSRAVGVTLEAFAFTALVRGGGGGVTSV